jgi:hypothetical protein
VIDKTGIVRHAEVVVPIETPGEDAVLAAARDLQPLRR